MSTREVCKRSSWSEGESVIVETLMSNKHVVSKEQPVAHTDLLVGQELSGPCPWRVPGATPGPPEG